MKINQNFHYILNPDEEKITWKVSFGDYIFFLINDEDQFNLWVDFVVYKWKSFIRFVCITENNYLFI